MKFKDMFGLKALLTLGTFSLNYIIENILLVSLDNACVFSEIYNNIHWSQTYLIITEHFFF